jgi:hypothetical protein
LVGAGAILVLIGSNLQNILGFWGFFMDGRGILMKIWRDFGEKVRKSKSAIAHCYLLFHFHSIVHWIQPATYEAI